MIPRHLTLEIVRGVWIAVGVLWLVARLKTKRTAVRQPWRSQLVYGIFLVWSFLLLSGELSLGDVRLLRNRPELTGLSLVVVGAAVAVWSRLILARNWSGAVELKVGHELVVHGPYRWVRHPMYSGLLLMFLGTALVLGTAQAFGAVALFFVLHVWKLRAEESLLAQRFPDDFAGYKARTKALVPFLF